MKKGICFLIAILLLSVAAGCGAPEESASPAASDTPSPTATEQSPVPTEIVIQPTPEAGDVQESGLSATTGLPTEKAYKPFCVMVENSPAARPQTGLQEADIIYEAMAEGGITRFICIFNDKLPVKVGPIRSTRLYYINIQREWDGPLVHYGGPGDAGAATVYGSDFNDIKLRLDGLKGGYGKYFWRDSERSAPNNVYTNLCKFMDLYDYTPNARTQFVFNASKAYEAKTVSRVGIPFLSGKPTHTEFVYDAATDKFTRYLSGKTFDVRTVFEDASGKQTTEVAPLTVQNLIVQYANTHNFPNDPKGRRMVDVVGSGKCEFFIGGKHISGNWSRESLTSSTIYTAEDGTPIELKPGNTWIALQPTSGEITVTYAE